MLNYLLKIMRIDASDTELVEEIQGLMEEAIADLSRAGINASGYETDACLKQAIRTFVKGHYGFDNPDREALLESYEKQKINLSIGDIYVVE